MPLYCFYCRECDLHIETTRSMSESTEPFLCPQCGGECKRDFTSEGVISTFHPTVDLVALKKKTDIRKNKRPPIKERY